jgi:hypothetical protein
MVGLTWLSKAIPPAAAMPAANAGCFNIDAATNDKPNGIIALPIGIWGTILLIALPAIMPMPAPAIGKTMDCIKSNFPPVLLPLERVRRAGIAVERRRRGVAVAFLLVVLFLIAIL